MKGGDRGGEKDAGGVGMKGGVGLGSPRIYASRLGI